MKLPLPAESPCDEGTVFDYDRARNRDGNAYFVFWWDGEYKLAKIVPRRRNTVITTVASVWVSSSPETWSEISVGFDSALQRPTEFPSGCDIVVGDFAYWIVFKSTDRRVLLVMSLNLKTLALSLYEIPFPVHHSFHSSPDEIFEKLVHKQNYVLFAANWKGEFALVERMDSKYVVWTMDVDQGWSEKCSFNYPVLKWIKDVSGKAVVMITVYTLGRPRVIKISSYDDLRCGIALYDVGTGEAEVIEDFIHGDLVDSTHDFVGSFASIKGFKPIEDAEKFRVFWPYPSASRTNGKYDMKI